MGTDAKIHDLDDIAGNASTNDGLPAAYQVSLVGPGLQMDRSLTEQQAWAVMAIIFGKQVGDDRPTASQSGGADDDPPRTAAPSGEVPPTTPPPTRNTGIRHSVGEFITESGAQTNTDKITAIGAYLQDNEGKSVFSREEISAQFQRAGEPKPGNFHRDFTVALTKKWIAASDADGQFYLTRSGRTAISERFKSERRRAPSRKGTDKRSAAETDT